MSRAVQWIDPTGREWLVSEFRESPKGSQLTFQSGQERRIVHDAPWGPRSPEQTLEAFQRSELRPPGPPPFLGEQGMIHIGGSAARVSVHDNYGSPGESFLTVGGNLYDAHIARNTNQLRPPATPTPATPTPPAPTLAAPTWWRRTVWNVAVWMWVTGCAIAVGVASAYITYRFGWK